MPSAVDIAAAALQDSLNAAIAAQVLSPKSVEGDDGKVTMHDPNAQLDAAERLGQKLAVKKRHRGLYRTRLVPPSGTGS